MMGEHPPTSTTNQLRFETATRLESELKQVIRRYLNLYGEVPEFVDQQVDRILEDLKDTAYLMREEQGSWDR